MIPKSLRTCSRCGAKRGNAESFGPCPNPQCTESPFALTNPPPKREKWQGEPAPKCRQRKLLTGMSCLSGQENLFDT